MMWKADFGTACGWTQEHAPRISALTFESAAGDVLSFLPALPTLFASENSPANSARMRLRRITSSMCGPQGNEVFNFARVIVRPCHKHIQAARRSRRWEHHNSSDGGIETLFLLVRSGLRGCRGVVRVPHIPDVEPLPADLSRDGEIFALVENLSVFALYEESPG